MGRNVRKHTLRHVRPAKIQISLRNRIVIKIFLDAFWIAKDAKLPHVDIEDWSDCADGLTYSSIRWAHMSEGTFSHFEAQIFSVYSSSYEDIRTIKRF